MVLGRMVMDRYLRQTLVAQIGTEGQKRLTRSRVLLVGCGGLGTNISNILVRAGVGFIRIIDRDIVELSNLQRQGLFSEDDVKGRIPKALAAERRLRTVNSEVEVEAVVTELCKANLSQYAGDVDLILDGTDNFTTRFLINDYAVEKGIPWIHGGVAATSGMVMDVIPGRGPCLRCLYPNATEKGRALTTDVVGVLGTLTSVIGALQANEALKYLSGNSASMLRGLLYIDLWENTYQVIEVSRKADCEACGKGQ
jgi:molybdopterin/thiamine biosynthesis adenylyltransferase